MIEKRRGFLKKIGYTAAGLGCGFPLLRVLASEDLVPHNKEKAPANQLGLVIDIKKCLNANVMNACINACANEHNAPEPYGPQRKTEWIWTQEYRTAFPDQTHEYYPEEKNSQPVLMLCNHCTAPACVKVCPTGATWKRKNDGIVMMDMHRCIGCRYCMAACPYGARCFNWSDPRPHLKGKAKPDYPTRTKGVVEKCTFCAKRIRQGLEPACVEASNSVPGGKGALTFGDLSNPGSKISRLLRETRTINRISGHSTGPNIYYIV